MPATLPSHTILILGPTAVGKSELAVSIAERVGGEIISADAYQIYAGLPTLSAQPDAMQLARVPHHLVGILPLSETCDVARWLALAHAAVADVVARGRVPIVCGGAGMYVRALTHGLSEAPPADPVLRAELEKSPLPELAARLRELDPANTVDEQNPRRVIRALEVCLLSGRPFSSFREQWDSTPRYAGVTLTRPREQLLARITQRTAAMFPAVLDEVRAISQTPLSATAAQMLGLREIQEHLAGKLTREQTIAAIAIATRQYAKRQLTWFRKEAYPWLDMGTVASPVDATLELIRRGT